MVMNTYGYSLARGELVNRSVTVGSSHFGI